MTETRKTWQLVGVKKTRTHTIKLLADTADEAIAIAKRDYRFRTIHSCTEFVPVRSPGGSTYWGLMAENDPYYENAGWRICFGRPGRI